MSGLTAAERGKVESLDELYALEYHIPDEEDVTWLLELVNRLDEELKAPKQKKKVEPVKLKPMPPPPPPPPIYTQPSYSTPGFPQSGPSPLAKTTTK